MQKHVQVSKFSLISLIFGFLNLFSSKTEVLFEDILSHLTFLFFLLIFFMEKINLLFDWLLVWRYERKWF